MTETTSDQQKGSFGLLFFAVLIDLLGFGIIIPILPFLVKDVNPAQEGVLLASLLAIYSLSQFVFAPLWGKLSDRVGRRPVILIGLLGSSFGFALFGLVTTYPLYLVSRLIAGIFTGATLPTSRAYIADITPPQDRARRFGLLGAAFGIGFTFGPAIGSILSLDLFLIPGLPEQAPAALFASSLALVNFFLARARLPESLDLTAIKTSERPSITQQFRSISLIPQIPIFLVIFGLTTLIFSGFETILPLFANVVDNRINEENIGYFFAMIGVLIAIFQTTTVGPVVKRYGEELTVLLAISLQFFGFFLMGISSNLLHLGLVMIPLSFGTALLNPSVTAAISKRIPVDQQGSGLGITSSLGSLGRVIGPLYAGLLYDNFSPQAPFWLNSLLLATLFIIVYRPIRNIFSVQNNETG